MPFKTQPPVVGASIDFAIEAPDHSDARRCLAAYFDELALRFEAGFDPQAGKTEADRAMSGPTGAFVVARRDGEPVGCGGFLRFDDGIAEIKRMWIAPSARGLGLARRLLRFLEEEARTRGYRRVRLDTNRALAEAQSLYRAEGYRDIPRYSDNPYAHHWFEKTLLPASG